MARISRRRSSLPSAKCYSFIENVNTQKLFQYSDRIFAALKLRLCIIDTDVNNETNIRQIRQKLLKAITENDSTIWPKHTSFNRIPEDLANDTIANELELRNQMVRTKRRYYRIQDLQTHKEAEIRSSCLKDLENEVYDEIESSVIFDEKCHFFLCVLMPEFGLPEYGSPLLGGAIALTGADGELEIRWAFSKLPQFLNELGPEKYQRISNELEGIFALRMIAEAMFLEDLRVKRYRANIPYRSERTQRFVSIVSVDFTHFPLGMANTLIRVPNMTRHYNTHEEKAARHQVPCKCRARLENIAIPSIEKFYLSTNAISDSVEVRVESSTCVNSEPNADINGVTYISDSDDSKSSIESTSHTMNEESLDMSTNLDKEDLSAWSFYGISFNGFERALNQIFNMHPLLNTGGIDIGVLQILNGGLPTADLLLLNDILVSRFVRNGGTGTPNF